METLKDWSRSSIKTLLQGPQESQHNRMEEGVEDGVEDIEVSDPLASNAKLYCESQEKCLCGMHAYNSLAALVGGLALGIH